MALKRTFALFIMLCMIVSLAAPAALAVGPFDSVATPVTMSALAVRHEDGTAYIKLTAKMNMHETLAKAAILGPDASALDRVRFVCTLTLPASVELDWDSLDLSEALYTVSGPGTKFTHAGKDYTVYEFESIYGNRANNEIVMTYKLTQECRDNIRYLGADGGVAALRKEVKFSAELDNVKVTFNGDSHTVTSRVDVTRYPTLIDVINAANGSTAIYLGTEGEEGNEAVIIGVNDKITVKTNETITVEDGEVLPIGEITFVTEDPKPGLPVEFIIDPAPGKKVVSVRIVSEDGTVIEYDYNGEGDFTFDMPAGDVVIEIEYADAPYLPEDSGVGVLLNTDDHIAFVVGNDQGTFKPYDPVLRCEVAMMFYRLLRNPDIEITQEFKDIDETRWYATAMKALATLGIFKGNNGYVYPDAPMTRAEFAAACVRFATIEPHRKNIVFSDVPSNHWAYEEIQKAAAFGWIVGFNGEFNPDGLINRTEACTVINRMLARPADAEAIDSGKGVYYPDVNPGTDWGFHDITEATTVHDTDVDHVWYVEGWTQAYQNKSADSKTN